MMPDKYLTAPELCARWRGKISLRTLRLWRERKNGRGPAFLVIYKAILYPIAEVERYEGLNTIARDVEAIEAEQTNE